MSEDNMMMQKAQAARIAVLLLILLDAMFLVSLLASDGYAWSANLNSRFRSPFDQTPSLALGLVVVFALTAGAICMRMALSRQRGKRVGIALALVLVALACQLALTATLTLANPLHAYGSFVLLIFGLQTVHILITAVVGLLVLGRLRHGRLDGRDYILSAASAWWTYVAFSSLLIWLATAVIG